MSKLLNTSALAELSKVAWGEADAKFNAILNIYKAIPTPFFKSSLERTFYKAAVITVNVEVT